MDTGRKDLEECGFRFPILTAFVNICTVWVEEATLTKEHVLHFELMVSITEDEEKEAWNKFKLKELQVPVLNFKTQLVKVFRRHCNYGLFTLKVHLQVWVTEDLCGI